VVNRFLVAAFAILIALAIPLTSAFAAEGKARVRVVHASPDAPAVDVLVDGNKAFTNAPFKGITDYASLDPKTYDVKVVPTGASTPVVIDADLPLAANTDYTVVAVGKLASIEPLVLTDNNAKPAAGKAHVRFVHASPDAPAVDIAVKGGPVIFSNVAFKKTGTYTPVDAGTYDLEVRLAGTSTVALSVPGVKLDDGTVYTIFAMGLASVQPALTAVASADAAHANGLPRTGGPALAIPIALGLAALAMGLYIRTRPTPAAIRVERDR
jgi:hypothetical protein